MFFRTDQSDLINVANTTKITREGERVTFHYLGNTRIGVDLGSEKDAKDLIEMFSMQFAINQIPENVSEIIKPTK